MHKFSLIAQMARNAEEHRQLKDFLAQYTTAVEQKDPVRKLIALMEQVLDYEREHSREEERLMARAAYPELAQHRHAHAQLTERVVELLLRLRGADVAASAETGELLRSLFWQHVDAHDARFLSWLEGRNNSAPRTLDTER